MKRKKLAKGLYYRKDSKNIWCRFTDQHGVSVAMSTGTNSPSDAQAILEKVRTDVREGKWFDKKASSANMLFGDLLAKYEEFASTHTPRSWTSDKYLVRKFKRELGNYMLASISRELVESYRAKLVKRGLAVNTINDQIKTLKNVVVKGYHWKLITAEQRHDIADVKGLRGGNKRLRYLTVEEIPVLLRGCPTTIRPIVMTALHTGARRGEILRLRWTDYDQAEGILTIGKSKNDEGRSIPVTSSLREVLDEMKRNRRIDTQLIFPSKKGTIMDNFQTSWESAKKRAGIEDFKFHDLRHTFASQMIQAGVGLAEVQKLLGHKSIKMTMRYAHLCHSMTSEAVKKLDDRLKNGTTFLLRSAVNE